MRIGINGRFYAARITGVQRFAREVTARLSRMAETVVFLPGGTARDESLPADTPVVRGRLRGHVWEQVELPLRARDRGLDLLLHLANTAPVLGSRQIVTAHDILPLTNPEWFDWRFAAWYRLAQGIPTRRALGVLTVSEWSRGEISRVLGRGGRDVIVTPQGAGPFDRPASEAAVRRVRERWSLPDTFLLTVGGGDPRKNLPFLVEVMQRLARAGHTLPLVVTGEPGSRVFGSPARPTDSPLIHLLGYVEEEDLHALYTAATLFCYPSLGEGFGRPPLEAIACGTPAVVADYGPAHEVVGDAALVLPLDLDRWVESLAALVADPAERAARAARGRAVASRHRWDDAARVVLDACLRFAGAGEAVREALAGD